MRTIAILLVLVTSAAAQDTRPASDPALDIGRRFIEATGGEDAHAAVRTQRQVGSVELPNLGLTGKLTILVAAPDRIRVSVDFPNVGKVEQGVTGGVGWANDPINGPRLMDDGERVLLARGLAPPTLDDPFDVAHAKATGEPESVTLTDGTKAEAFRVDLETRDGQAVSEWYDAETGLRLRREAMWRGTFGEERQAIDYADWQPVGDTALLAPFESRQTVFGGAIIIRISEADAHVELDDDAFAPPPAVQELLDRRRDAAE